MVRRDLDEPLVRADRLLPLAGPVRGLRELDVEGRLVGNQLDQPLEYGHLRLVGRGCLLPGRVRPGPGRGLECLHDRVVAERSEEAARAGEGECRGRDVPARDLDEEVLREPPGVRRLDVVQRCELAQAARVLGAHLRVALEDVDRLIVAAGGLERRGELGESLRVVRALIDLLLRVRDGRPRVAPAEDVGEDVADTRPADAGADAQRDEAERENPREEGEYPLAPAAEPREEELVLVARLLLLGPGGYPLLRLLCASIRPRALAAASRSSCHPEPPLVERGTPSTMVRHTRSGVPPKTTATSGSSHGRYGEPASETIARSARLPGVREPTSPSSRRGSAEPSVARRRASRADRAALCEAPARASAIAARISSNMSNDGVEAGLSVPRPTRTPARRSSATGAIPQPSSAFDRGQCATATSWRARSAISSAS